MLQSSFDDIHSIVPRTDQKSLVSIKNYHEQQWKQYLQGYRGIIQIKYCWRELQDISYDEWTRTLNQALSQLQTQNVL